MARQGAAHREDSASPTLVNFEDLQRKLSHSLSHPIVERSDPDVPIALDLVYKAAGALEALEKRANEVEAWALQSIQQLEGDLRQSKVRETNYVDRITATEELARGIQARLSSSEQRAGRAEELVATAQHEIRNLQARLDDAEERARRAEERATKAEAWLAHAQDVISTNLSKLSASADTTSEDVVRYLERRVEQHRIKGPATQASPVRVVDGGALD